MKLPGASRRVGFKSMHTITMDTVYLIALFLNIKHNYRHFYQISEIQTLLLIKMHLETLILVLNPHHIILYAKVKFGNEPKQVTSSLICAYSQKRV